MQWFFCTLYAHRRKKQKKKKKKKKKKEKKRKETRKQEATKGPSKKYSLHSLYISFTLSVF